MICTTRCELTTLRDTDLDYVVRLYTDTNVHRFLGGPVDEQTIHLRFAKLQKTDELNQCWVIRLKKDSSFVGIVSLGTHHDGIDTEISYLLLPEWWGRGYATEAVQAVVTHALTSLGLPRVIAETQTCNDSLPLVSRQRPK